jgi:hypothetical protein
MKIIFLIAVFMLNIRLDVGSTVRLARLVH